MSEPLTDRERAVVDLIAEGYARWRIAELMGVSEAVVRKTIRHLCERYDCPMRDLPARVAE